MHTAELNASLACAGYSLDAIHQLVLGLVLVVINIFVGSIILTNFFKTRYRLSVKQEHIVAIVLDFAAARALRSLDC